MNKLNNWTSEAAEKKRKTKEKFYGYSEGGHAESWSDTRGMGGDNPLWRPQRKHLKEDVKDSVLSFTFISQYSRHAGFT